MRYTTAILLLALAFTACNNADEKTNNTATALVATEQQPTDYYKRFSGTIAGQPVVMHLQVNSRSYAVTSGTYYYVKQGKPIGLYMLPDSTVSNGYIADEESESKNDATQPHWKVVYNGSTIIGKWTSADGQKSYDIDLKENYPQGSYKLSVWSKEDSIPFKVGRASPSASITYELMRAGKDMIADDAAFYEKTLQTALGCDTLQASSLEDCISKQVTSYAASYREMLADVDDTLLGEAFNNYYNGTAMSVVYNDNGMLVIATTVSDYSGGAHGNYFISYLNIDMQNRKLWKLEDIITVDSVKLQRILETKARKEFDVPASQPLSEGLLVDRVMPNGNFYITSTGITFVYNPYEIAAYAYGIGSFFIPFTQIKDLLKPDFKQRMNV